MLILGIESTCDETGVAVVEDGVKVMTNFIASSVAKLAKYGGVVPEVVARDQVRFIIPLIDESLIGIGIEAINAIAVSYGPGLIGSLLVGVETAKTLATVWDKPLIPVNHLKGHIYANWLAVDNSPIRQAQGKQFKEKKSQKSIAKQVPTFPLVALVVSGGHTDLVLMKGHGDFKLLGSTLDDAAGEAFDKVARILGLGYPGGPEIDKMAKQFTVNSSSFLRQDKQLSVKFPRPMINSQNFNFSFSGIKTSVANLVNKQSLRSSSFDKLRTEGLSSSFMVHSREQIAFEFQEAVCDVLVSKTLSAAKKFEARSIVVGGGVAANSRLREQLTLQSRILDVDIFFPPKNLSVDNGAMIAAAAFFNQTFIDPIKISANPNLHF